MKLKFEMMYLFYSTQELTQRKIADALNISLGQVNKIIAGLVEEDMITISEGYLLSDLGKAYLEQHRVDNAVIMAAGFGSRFVPLTYDTPKGLLEVHGERMIERQIKQLHEAEIYDITIVVGYLKERFEYLSDKYNVSILYNPDFANMNNIASLFHAKKILKNTYVLTSDIYMPKNIYRKYEAYSYYASQFLSGWTDEWGIETNKHDRIIDVVDGGGEDTWAMYGPSFFKSDFSQKISHLIDDYYLRNSSAQWYWEDVYMRHLDELEMYTRKFSQGTILEFESLEELRSYDTSYLVSSQSDILDTIGSVFSVEQAEITKIQTLKEGMTNDSFLFEVKRQKYVFRAPGKGTDLLLNRFQEYNVYTVINDLKLSDKIIYLDPSSGYKISEFIPDSRTLNSADEQEVTQAINLLRSFHQRELKVEHSFDIEERISFYLELCKQKNAVLFDDFDAVFALIKRLIANLKTFERKKVLCHIDSVPVNFLVSPGRMTLLDWEYSGMADPLLDLAMYVVFDGLKKDGAVALLETYLQRKPEEDECTILFSYIALAGFLWSLWTQYKQSQGNDFGTYGIEQYRYARKFSRYVLDKEN